MWENTPGRKTGRRFCTAQNEVPRGGVMLLRQRQRLYLTQEPRKEVGTCSPHPTPNWPVGSGGRSLPTVSVATAGDRNRSPLACAHQAFSSPIRRCRLASPALLPPHWVNARIYFGGCVAVCAVGFLSTATVTPGVMDATC